MKKTKRLFLSSCLPRQAVGGRGGGRARERRGDRKERERKNDATRRCVCQRREKGPIGEAGAATRETKIDSRRLHFIRWRRGAWPYESGRVSQG